MINNSRRRQMMQRRTAYAAFEKTILDLYDQRSLTLDLLDRIADHYHWLHVGSTGSQYGLTHDGKDLYQVCIELVDPSFPITIRGSSGDHEEYWEKELRKWEDIVRWRWNWHIYSMPHSNLYQQNKAA